MRAQMCPKAPTTKESTQEEGGPKNKTTTSLMADQQRETAQGTTFPYQSVEREQMVLVFKGNWRKM